MQGLTNRFEAEEKAQIALADLMRQAREVRRLYEEAGMSMPPTLARFFDSAPTPAEGQIARPTIMVTPVQYPPRPSIAKDDWISVPISELTVSNLLLGILRENGKPMMPKERMAKLEEYQPGTNFGSSLNVGARMEGEVIEKTDDGWRLLDESAAPFFYKGNAWAPVSVFQNTERTSHRRQLILHILKASGVGLEITQILKLVVEGGQCKVPVNKDAIKGDLEALRVAKQVVGSGRPRKWRLNE